MILARTVIVPERLARANVLDAFRGAGAPSGIVACTVDDDRVVISFESERTAPELIDALIEIETDCVPARVGPPADWAAAAAVAARGLLEPALDASRIIETYLS